MRRALVTGGAGFIGSSLVRHLLAHGWAVTVYDKLNPGRRDFLPDDPNVELVVADILDEQAFSAALDGAKAEIVFHLAAIHYIPYCNAHPQEAMRTNVDGTEAVFRLSKAAGVPRVVFCSTAAVYPSATGPLHEVKTPTAPLDIYGFTKWFGEELADWMARDGETRFAVGRLFNVYGPRETSPHLIPALLKQMIEGLNTLKVGNLEPKRDYIYVEDMARALYELGVLPDWGRAEPIRANLGTGTEHSVREVMTGLAAVSGVDLTLEQDPARMRASDRPNLLADVSTLRSLVGWTPETDFRTGLEKLYAWAKDHPELMVG